MAVYLMLMKLPLRMTRNNARLPRVCFNLHCQNTGATLHSGTRHGHGPRPQAAACWAWTIWPERTHGRQPARAPASKAGGLADCGRERDE